METVSKKTLNASRCSSYMFHSRGTWTRAPRRGVVDDDPPDWLAINRLLGSMVAPMPVALLLVPNGMKPPPTA